MAYMPIYPMFHIGDKVKAGSYIAYSKGEKHFTKYDVTPSFYLIPYMEHWVYRHISH